MPSVFFFSALTYLIVYFCLIFESINKNKFFFWSGQVENHCYCLYHVDRTEKQTNKQTKNKKKTFHKRNKITLAVCIKILHLLYKTQYFFLKSLTFMFRFNVFLEFIFLECFPDLFLNIFVIGVGNNQFLIFCLYLDILLFFLGNQNFLKGSFLVEF